SPLSSPPSFSSHLPHPYLHSFPTRRSSDLGVPRRKPHAHRSVGDVCRPGSPAFRRWRVWRNFLFRHPSHPRNRHSRQRRKAGERSEEHTSELQSPDHLVCRLLLEKKKRQTN